LKKNKVTIKIERCKGCKLCVGECKQGIIKVSDELNKLGYHPVEITNMEKCTGCTLCAIACPEAIIEVIREED
jgi:2-oxoglutarate ferredoxin oxidoreductase subunit delta